MKTFKAYYFVHSFFNESLKQMSELISDNCYNYCSVCPWSVQLNKEH